MYSLSLSPDLDLEFKTFSIFPLQTQIGAPGGGTWLAGTSNQSPAAVKFSVQDSSSSFQLTRLLALCPVSSVWSPLSFGQNQVLLRQNTALRPHWPHCTGPCINLTEFLNGRSFEWFEHLFWVNIFLSFLSILWRFPCLGAQRLNSCTINCSFFGSDCLDRRYSYILIHFTPLHS